ncbi:MAG: GMC family oxidoreductase [Proteobacteria bacterium]|nr:GMC family oxidoreductase [Pseudomonadota bacterium]
MHIDIIVVGTGLSGGWAAKELTEQGFSVLALDSGAENPRNEANSPSNLQNAMQGDTADYLIQSKNYIFSDRTRHLFNNDRLNPYVRSESKPFNWIRTNAVGGRSLLWAGSVYRWSDLDFEANKRDGHGVDWPIRYADLEKWYGYVEDFIGISGCVANFSYLPDGNFLPPMEYTALEKKFKRVIHDNYNDRLLTIGRTAILSVDHNGRSAYLNQDPSLPIYQTDSLFKSINSTLPAAEKTGNLTIRANSLVKSLVYDKKTNRVTAVRVVDTHTGGRSEISARVVFLCASTIASTQILLNSRCESFKNGLANSSGVLGHYLMDHMAVISAIGVMPSTRYAGTGTHVRPAPVHIPRFQNLHQQEKSFLRGYGYLAWEDRVDGAYAPVGMGALNPEYIKNPTASAFTLMGFGECLPYYDNLIKLDEHKKNKFGIPLVNIEFNFKENEVQIVNDMAKEAEAMLALAGFESIVENTVMPVGGSSIHEMGTARMGRDPKTSVLNGFNQSHDIPNLFVTDGACMASSSHVHPSLTYMALTARACAYATNLMKSGVI